jgi:hypothetical protein
MVVVRRGRLTRARMASVSVERVLFWRRMSVELFCQYFDRDRMTYQNPGSIEVLDSGVRGSSHLGRCGWYELG